MKRPSRDTLLALVLFVLLTAVTAVSVWQETQDAADLPPLSSDSNEPEGARALFLYLRAVGFFSTNNVSADFSIPARTDVVLLLEPQPGITEAEWVIIDDWVRDGGTLIIAGWEFGTDLAMTHYDGRLSYLSEETAVVLQSPLLLSPPPSSDATLTTEFVLQTDRRDIITHVATEPDGQPVVVSFAQGDGRVILSSMPQVFTNQGLQIDGHAELAMNHIAGTKAPLIIWFDEWHHGVRLEAAAVGSWLQRTPAGRALLYVALIIFIGLVLRGRIFGRPVPLPQESNRRAPLEYISGISNLSRRAGHRTAVLQDYRLRLKRQLGHRYRLNPTLPDAEFVRQLAEYDPNLDAAALENLLTRLARRDISEHDLVELAAEAADYEL